MKRLIIGTIAELLLVCVSLIHAAPTPAEQAKLDWLAGQVHGKIAYCKGNAIYEITIGDWTPRVLVDRTDYPMEQVRYSADGKKIAWQAHTASTGLIGVMNADGSGFRQLTEQSKGWGCITFHPNGREIIVVRRNSTAGGIYAMDINTGAKRDIWTGAAVSFRYEPSISADGNKMTCETEEISAALDLATMTRFDISASSYSCSPTLSPDGTKLLNNYGSHNELEIHDWPGKINTKRISSALCSPDAAWDCFHFSNHNDFVVFRGDRVSAPEVYVVPYSSLRSGNPNYIRVTWGGTNAGANGLNNWPDMWVGNATATGVKVNKNDKTDMPVVRMTKGELLVQVPQVGAFQVVIYDFHGKAVRTMQETASVAGSYKMRSLSSLPSGQYLCLLKQGNYMAATENIFVR